MWGFTQLWHSSQAAWHSAGLCLFCTFCVWWKNETTWWVVGCSSHCGFNIQFPVPTFSMETCDHLLLMMPDAQASAPNPKESGTTWPCFYFLCWSFTWTFLCWVTFLTLVAHQTVLDCKASHKNKAHSVLHSQKPWWFCAQQACSSPAWLCPGCAGASSIKCLSI